MSIGWQPDAAHIQTSEVDLEDYVVKTAGVNQFLEPNKRVIVAPKGFGKTLLLKYMHELVFSRSSSKGYIRIPNGMMMDSFDNRATYEAKLSDFLAKYQNWEDLWQLAICTSVLVSVSISSKSSALIDELLESVVKCKSFPGEYINELESIKTYIRNKTGIPNQKVVKFNPSYVLVMLLGASRRELSDSIDVLRSTAHQAVISIQQKVVLFIDQIDQGISAYSEEVWRHAQCGLLGAIFKLGPQTQIVVYASIRREAWEGFQHEQKRQMRDLVAELEYTDQELKEIFEHTIQVIEMADNRGYRGNVISRFLEQERLSNSYTNDIEELFSYILRHTLRRPRDLISIGEEIHKKKEHGALVKEDLIRVVNETPSRDIHDQYFEEVSRFFRCFQDVDKQYLFSLIRSNVLTRWEMIGACSQYNREVSCYYRENSDVGGMRECANCSGKNYIFSDLHRVGLLGVVVNDATNPSPQNYVQKFRKIGSIGFGLVPESNYYLIHPSIDHLISHYYENNRYFQIPGILIGHGLSWGANESALMMLHDLEPIMQSFPAEIKSEIAGLINELKSNVHSEEMESKVRIARNKILDMKLDGVSDAAEFVKTITTTLVNISNLFA